MTADMDAGTGSGSGGGAIEARFKALEEENAKLRKEMGSVFTAVTEIGTNMNAGFRQLMQGSHRPSKRNRNPRKKKYAAGKSYERRRIT